VVMIDARRRVGSHSTDSGAAVQSFVDSRVFDRESREGTCQPEETARRPETRRLRRYLRDDSDGSAGPAVALEQAMTSSNFESITLRALATVAGGVDDDGGVKAGPGPTTQFETGGGIRSGRRDRFTTGGTIEGGGPFTTGGSF
jgi:hypothetical protein